jgi:hypothetical protein
MRYDRLATDAQLNYIRDLCAKLGYDPETYIPHMMTMNHASQVIKELKEEYD